MAWRLYHDEEGGGAIVPPILPSLNPARGYYSRFFGVFRAGYEVGLGSGSFLGDLQSS